MFHVEGTVGTRTVTESQGYGRRGYKHHTCRPRVHSQLAFDANQWYPWSCSSTHDHGHGHVHGHHEHGHHVHGSVVYYRMSVTPASESPQVMGVVLLLGTGQTVEIRSLLEFLIPDF